LDDLKKLRNDRDLRQEDIGLEITHHKAWVSQVERGKLKPTEDDMRNLAKVLNVDLRYKDSAVRIAHPDGSVTEE
jgi:ribosome-binding protein aMBF1 (putative translation factor)